MENKSKEELELEFELELMGNIKKIQEELGCIPDEYLFILALMAEGKSAAAAVKEYLHLTKNAK